MFDIKEHSVEKGEKSSHCPDHTPDFHVIFHEVRFFNTNENVKKNKVIAKVWK